jgi:hypothetical protein
MASAVGNSKTHRRAVRDTNQSSNDARASLRSLVTPHKNSNRKRKERKANLIFLSRPIGFMCFHKKKKKKKEEKTKQS